MKIWQKTIAAVATFALLFNSLSAPLIVLAQEMDSASLTTTPTPEVAPTIEPTVEPTVEPSTDPTPTDTPTLVPSPTTEESVTPTPLDLLTPTPEAVVEATPTGDLVTPTPEGTPETQNSTNENTQSQGPPSDSNQSTPAESSASPSITPTATPTFTPESLPENATVTTTIVSTDVFPSTVQNELFKLITDKLDYTPSEIAIITGSNFDTSKTYSITVSSSDDPATAKTEDITTDASGGFTYYYQLDGKPRPNYRVEVKNNEGTIVATTTFTDTPTPITTVNVYNLQPDWTSTGGEGVFAAYIGPPTYGYVSPGITTLYNGREAGIIKAGLNIDTGGHYQDEGLLAFQLNENISSFASEILTYDVNNQTGPNPVWVRIRLVGGIQYQFIPTTNPAGWHTVNAATGQWQLMDDNGNGNGIGSLMSLAEVAAANSGVNVDRVYLTLGMGDSYNVSPGVGTVAWIDKVTINNKTYDFVVDTSSKVTICHSTASSSNPYIVNEPDKSADVGGHDGHTDDIIPPFDYSGGSYPGKNWSTFGQTVWNNGCSIPVSVGALIVNKVTIPAGNLSEFTITAKKDGGNGTVTDPAIRTDFSTINPQTFLVSPDHNYKVDETVPDNWIQLSNSCNGVHIDAGETKTCTITNSLKTGSITFEKQIIGTPTDLSAWTFNITGTNGNFTAKNGDDKSLPLGTYNITESGGPTNYHLFDASGACDYVDNEIVLTVGSDGGTCTIVNKRDVSGFKVQKLDENNQPIAGWKFKLDDGAWIQTDAQGQVEFNSLETGNYTVTEESRAGMYLSEVTSVTDSCQKIANNNNSATVEVPYSTRPVCVFKNIPIPKYEGPSTCPTDKPDKKLIGTHTIGSTDTNGETLPEVISGNSYLFEASGTFSPTSAPGYISDAGYTWLNGLLAAQYGINGVPPDYGAHALLANLGSGVGIVNWGTPNTNNHTYSVYYTPTLSSPQFVIGDRWSNWYGTTYDNQAGMFDNSGDLTLNVYTCSAPKGTIEIKKVISPHDTSTFWNFGIYDGIFWDTWKTDGYDSGPINVTPGKYNVVEQTAPGTDGTKYISTVECKDGETTVATGGPASMVYGQNMFSSQFSVASGQHIVCTFTNTLAGTIEVKKVILPHDTSTFWNFGIDVGLLWDTWRTDGYDSGPINVLPGIHNVTEQTAPGTDGTKYSSALECKDGDRVITTGGPASLKYGDNLVSPYFNVESGQHIVCTFTNTKMGLVSGMKFNDLNGNGKLDNGEPGLQNWTINISGPNDYHNSTTTDASGNYSFTNLSTGDYIITETQQTGWTETTPDPNTISVNVQPGANLTGNNFGNHEMPATVFAQKIVCNNESDLPNWGTGNQGKNINAGTAQDYVDSHPGCQIVNGWNFQWANAGSGTFDSFQTSTASLGNPWTTFGPTVNGIATATVENPLQLGGRIEAREVFPNNNYVPFSGDDNNNYSSEFYCTGDTYHYDNWEWINNPQPGATYYCVAFNALNTGSVTVTKFDDLNQNGFWDQGENGEPVLDDWNIVLDQVGQLTVKGETTFSNLTPGKHILNETLQGGYIQTNIYCDREAGNWNNDGQFEVNVSAGVNTHCYIGNFEEKPGISITKTNNRGGGMSAGSVVDYTITLTNTGNITVSDVTIQDILPGGFTYVPGSTTGETFSDPSISGSILSWTGLGPLNPEQSITINYRANSSSDLTDGLYTNFATCRAIKGYGDQANFNVLAFVTEDDNVDSRSVECNSANSTVQIGNGSSFGGSLGGQVLGISTVLGASTELPATGSSTILLVIALVVLGAGLFLNMYDVKITKKVVKSAKKNGRKHAKS